MLYRDLLTSVVLMLAHLERAAGQLQLNSKEQAAELLLAAAQAGHQQLFTHGLRCLEAHFAAGSGGEIGGDSDTLRLLLKAAVDDNSSSCPATLQALLASGLRTHLDLDAKSPNGYSQLPAAVSDSCGAAKVQLLHQVSGSHEGFDSSH